jgi:hypothetical protein
MAKELTIQDLRNSILNAYRIKGADAKCDLTKYYDNPQDVVNYDITCLFNSIPDFTSSFNAFDYKNSLVILQNVAKKRFEDDNENIEPGIDYSDPNNFIYYDESNKVRY